jgi:transcriptional/translational regulatory protein YebC/TACO1
VFEEPETSETVVHTAPSELAKVRDSLSGQNAEVVDAELAFVPNSTIEISDPETARKIIRLMDALEDLDDVTSTHTNFELADSLSL